MHPQINHDRGPGLVRVLLASLVSILVALVVANAALAQDSGESTETIEPECINSTTQFVTVDGHGWAEVALRLRGLVLVDYEDVGDSEATVVTDTPDLIEIEFTTNDEVALLRAEHEKGRMLTEVIRRSVLATGSDAEATAGGPDSDGSEPDGATEPTDGSTGPSEASGDADSAEPAWMQESEAQQGASDDRPWLAASTDVASDGAGQTIEAGLNAVAYRQRG